MYRSPIPGCLSPLAITSAVATLLVLLILFAVTGSAMFSPGALNAQAGPPLAGAASHAEVVCAGCHSEPWSGQTMSDRCLDCHTTIQTELSNPTSLHGTLAASASAPCQECHTEHHGPAAALTIMDTADFPHEATGFALTAHRSRAPLTPFTCTDCHRESLASFDQITCRDCHSELDTAYTVAHQQDFGDDCLACHDGVDRYADFDHAQTGDPLTGGHAGLACAECHQMARSAADLQAASACASCHQEDDAHLGSYGVECEACHKPTTWQDASFDHSLSAFPLDGAHVEVDCQDCHRDQVYQGTPSECSACHEDPVYHAGMFPNQPCQDCHTTKAWRPARYDGRHTFPLNHGEKDNTCASCHQPTLKEWTCNECHPQSEIAGEHREEGITDFSDCLKCHPTGEEGEGEGGDGGDD